MVFAPAWTRWWVRGALLLLAVSIGVEHVAAQNARQRYVFPRDSYYATFRDYYDGDINQALRQFKAEGRRGLRIPGHNGIVSIG